MAVEKGDVGLGDLSLGEHLAEFPVSAVVFGDENEAAGLFVEAVDDAGTEVAADVGEFFQVEEQGVDEGAAVACVVGRAGSCVDHHAGGFVDDGEVFVFVEDVKGNVFGDGVKGRGLGGAFYLDGFAAVEFLLGLCQMAVDADLAGFDEELDAGAGDVGEGLGEVLVEAEIRGCGVGGEGVEACSSLRLRVRRTGTGGGMVSSTPRVARYSGFTVRRRWPLGSMFLDGMGDQLSRLQEKEEAGGDDHAEGYPLDGVEEGRRGIGLAEEGEEKLRGAGGGEGQGESVAGVAAMRELAEKEEGEDGRDDAGVEGDGVKRGGVGRDAEAPRQGGREAGVAAFGEVAEREEGPGEGSAGGPRIEGVEEGKLVEAEVDDCRDDGEDDARGGEGGHHKQKDGVGDEVVRIGGDEKETGEREGGEEGEEAGVPELVGVEANDRGGAKAEGEGGHESNGGEDAEGGEHEVAGVDEVGVHGELWAMRL